MFGAITLFQVTFKSYAPKARKRVLQTEHRDTAEYVANALRSADWRDVRVTPVQAPTDPVPSPRGGDCRCSVCLHDWESGDYS